MQDPPYSERSLELLQSWLNFNVMQTKLKRLPSDMAESNGRLLYEALEFMSGKAVPGKVSVLSLSTVTPVALLRG